MAQLFCVAKLANLEGFLGIPHPSSLFRMPSFEELAGRLKVVETQTGSSPSAPLTKSQWCNLAWRINYCHNRAEALRTMKASNSAVIWQLEGCTLSDAEDCFNTSFKFDRYQILQRDDVSRYFSLLQRVCFIAGEKGVRLDQIPATVWDIMALTCDLLSGVEAQTALDQRPRQEPNRGSRYPLLAHFWERLRRWNRATTTFLSGLPRAKAGQHAR
ncbi:hypothetical protein Purlil1_14263 [Purpureocillium lilacinum]|uniref:Uncharacterized protein n=1 Tax=Purpureocillium lilacinum TaxID=33203 RepID=A0ABR0BBR5_PURLI|nr:hypothetical protein Purlil1_14263 [Purpureocillium lilacinum]